jgi:orotate phosphoribosyltransferase
MSNAREALLQILAENSFKLGEFKLSSGGTSDYYVDCRATTLNAEGVRLTGRVFYDEIHESGFKPDAVGGMTMGADPIVTAIAMLSAQRIQGRITDSSMEGTGRKLIHAFVVRKDAKDHGTEQRIEGFRRKGARVFIVDDVCTTGTSIIQAIEASREFGFEVVGAICLVEREEARGRPQVEKAAAPAPFVSIFTAQDIREKHLHVRQQEDDPLLALGEVCDLCGRPAVTVLPNKRCSAHQE